VRANGCNHGIGYGVAGGGAPGAEDNHTFNWKLPVNGRIVAAGGHLHGGAKDMWMTQPRCQNRRIFDNTPAYAMPNHLVYRARPILHEPGPIDTRWFSSARGIDVRKGETLRLSATYDATMPHTVMSIMHIYVAPPRKGSSQGCSALPARSQYRKPGRFRFQPPLEKVPLNGIDKNGHTFVINNPGWPVKPLQDGAIIDIGANGYRPRAVEVPLGSSLTWRVKGATEHNVRFANGPRLITTVSLHNGETATRQFVRTGRYELFCSLHPVTMHQIVDVK
jgi:hypothetical protein